MNSTRHLRDPTRTATLRSPSLFLATGACPLACASVCLLTDIESLVMIFMRKQWDADNLSVFPCRGCGAHLPQDTDSPWLTLALLSFLSSW